MHKYGKCISWGLSALAMVAAVGWAAGQAGGSRTKAPAAGKDKKLRVLVVTGGHGYDKKTFPKVFSQCRSVELEIRELKNGSPCPFEDVSKWPYDVIVLYNCRNKLTESQRANFLKLMDRGVGLVVLHHAIVAYPDWDEWEKIIGAKYYLAPTTINGVRHARSVWKHGQDIPLHVEDPNHPITRGMKDFVVNDETYGKWTYFPGSRVLLTTTNPLNNHEVCWAKTYRNSRVVYMQLGHGTKAYTNAGYQRVVARSIQWVAGRIGRSAGGAKPAR
ncbi:MAG: ThuA domain-containing protein [Planctomycetes bacterium]|nr:ThuA domain-containing protein [Planctomycetota bacterium]